MRFVITDETNDPVGQRVILSMTWNEFCCQLSQAAGLAWDNAYHTKHTKRTDGEFEKVRRTGMDDALHRTLEAMISDYDAPLDTDSMLDDITTDHWYT